MSIETERHGGTVIVRINRPEAMNALDVPSMRALNAALRDFRDDPDVLVAILTGAGGRAFCAGADLKQTLPPAASFAQAYFQPYEQSVDDGNYIRAITLNDLQLAKPLIAAVNGHAIAGGLEIALGCDLRIASENATFALSEPRWATVTGVGGASQLLRAVPRAIAMKMILTGDRIDAHEAYRVGLVSDVVPPGELLDRALDIAERINANGPLAVKSLKTLAMRSGDLPLTQSIALEQLLWGLLRDTEDRIEGRKAFAERRPPEYRGR